MSAGAWCPQHAPATDHRFARRKLGIAPNIRLSPEIMNDLYSLIEERNRRETLPFLSIHSSNAYLRNHVDTLQARCESLERQYLEQQQIIAAQQQSIDLSSDAAASTKIEVRLREQIAKLQGDLREKVQNEVKSAAEAIEASNELAKSKGENAAQEAIISNLRMELARCDGIITHLQSELENSKSLARLAGKQIDGLKDAIRSLQEENDEISKLNKRLVDETVSEKEKMADQLNNMNTTIESQQKEVNMLRSYAKMGKGQIGGLFRGMLGDKNNSTPNTDKSNDADTNLKRQWGENTALPSQPLYTIKAHRDDASCVRYDGTNLNRVATASSDATVRVFDTSNGHLESTFSAGGRQPLIGVDIGGDIVCGCGADKTCRVWHLQTKRMIHQLAGHSQKITCVRLFPGEKSIITGSADRSIRLWDISRHIYTQTTTFRHSSTSNCVDVCSETSTAMSGHLDGTCSDVVTIIILACLNSDVLFVHLYFRWNSSLGCADKRPCIRYSFAA
jgi:autophagy-related protein 16